MADIDDYVILKFREQVCNVTLDDLEVRHALFSLCVLCAFVCACMH